MHKKILCLALAALLLLCGCAKAETVPSAPVVVTTMPLLEITSRLLRGSDVPAPVSVISEPVSCLHDYTLSVEQMQRIAGAELLITSGLGLEDFMLDALSASEAAVIDASVGVTPLVSDGGSDPHIWLAPENAAIMAENIADGLSEKYPQAAAKIAKNLTAYLAETTELQAYGEQTLNALPCRELITFHDGGSYLADAFGLTVAAAMEIEPGSEPSAKELEAIIELVRTHAIPAVFVEKNGTTDAAELVSRETGAKVYTLDMGFSGGDFIRNNIDTVKEALQ